ncbi:MAG TPA: hypothetical protein VKD25_08760, partial [Burkholderiales bacterium]|nr:hypothetical protein [Burkholderiales bacterium]
LERTPGPLAPGRTPNAVTLEGPGVSVRDDYQAIFAALHQAAHATIAANAQLIATNAQLAALAQFLTSATEATRAARDEHEDMRETVRRLEALITELQRRMNGEAGA